MNLMRRSAITDLFADLQIAHYEWQPQTPDRLLGFRKNPHAFRALVQWVGLGLPVETRALLDDGIQQKTLSELLESGLVQLSGQTVESQIAISGSKDLFVVHDHWPPLAGKEGEYVHYAMESAWLARALNRDLEGFIGKRVLDLGCSSGALSFELAGVAQKVLGIDISERAIEWAELLAHCYGFENTQFTAARIGDPEADRLASAHSWDIAVTNPPMVLPSPDASYPHRDGGKLGIEIPLTFVDFAAKHLSSHGELIGLFTNPIVNGRPGFFDALNRRGWTPIEKRCLHSHYNQVQAKKHGFAQHGVERIELWFLHLQRAG